MSHFDLTLELNGKKVTRKIPLRSRLLDALRYDFGLTGTKEGCGEGECGACTVLLSGRPVNSCLVLARQAEGCKVETVESTSTETLRRLNATGTSQCGACTPGIVMTARWLCDNPQTLDLMSLREFMSGNLCRCTGYDGVLSGIECLLDQEEGES